MHAFIAWYTQIKSEKRKNAAEENMKFCKLSVWHHAELFAVKIKPMQDIVGISSAVNNNSMRALCGCGGRREKNLTKPIELVSP